MATSPTSATATTMDDRATSVLVRFTPASVTTEQYDETIRRLEKSGDWLPEGLEFHVAFEAGGKFRVSEIWDSKAQFDAFGKRQHLAPRIGQKHPVAGALNQGQSCQRLQIPNLQRDGRLGQMQPFGGRCHRSIAVNGRQRAKLANGQFSQKPACHRRHPL